MGKVSLLDVAPTQGPDQTATANATVHGAVDATGGRFSILTNPDQIRLLYMISKYSSPARKAGDEELCVRFIPLSVLVYEAIVEEILQYDYAPSPRPICYQGTTRIVWMNISQECIAALDDFITKKLVNNVKLQSRDFTNVIAYQITDKGQKFLARAPKNITLKVDDFLYRGGDVLQVRFDGTDFEMYTDSGYNVKSGVTKIEDLSYVSSPWMPRCMRYGDKPFRSMEHRAYEAAQGGSELNSEMESVIFLRNVSLMLSEWLPMGPNQLSYLQDRLNVLGRCSGGLFTAQVDVNPDKTRFICAAGMTQVRILDFNPTEAVNFEAEIQSQEAEDITQVEFFAINVSVDGSITMGLNIDAIGTSIGKDRLSLDSICRLCVDVMNDSSVVTGDLLSEYQATQVKTVYSGQEMTREKYVLYIADAIEPVTKAESYINDSSFLSELRQILGDVQSVHCLSPDDVVFMGSKGCLAAGMRCRKHDEILVRFLVLMARENFVNALFNRLKVLNSDLVHIRELLGHCEEHPTRAFAIRDMLSNTSTHITLLLELQDYLRESLLGFRIPSLPNELPGRKMYSFMDLHKRLQDLLTRANDMKCLLKGAQNEHLTLCNMIAAVSREALEDVARQTTVNTTNLVEASFIEARNGQVMDVVNLIMSAGFIYAVMSKAFGGVENWTVSYEQEWFATLDAVPLANFVMHVGAFYIWSAVLSSVLSSLSDSANGFISWRVKMNRKIDARAMFAWLSIKTVSTIGVEVDSSTPKPRKVRSVTWAEEEHARWKGPPPKIEVTYDDTNGFLLQVVMELHLAKSQLTQEELLNLFQDDLIANRIMDKSQRLILPEFAPKANAEEEAGGELD